MYQNYLFLTFFQSESVAMTMPAENTVITQAIILPPLTYAGDSLVISSNEPAETSWSTALFNLRNVFNDQADKINNIMDKTNWILIYHCQFFLFTFNK